MHAVIEENLEELLHSPGAGGRAALDHLVSCKECAMELERMRQISLLFPALRSEAAVEPSPYFSVRVMNSIGRPRPFREGLFEALLGTTMDTAFVRRVAFASLLVLATLGGYLATTDAEFRFGVTPELIIAAERDARAADTDREIFLANLVSYQPDGAE